MENDRDVSPTSSTRQGSGETGTGGSSSSGLSASDNRGDSAEKASGGLIAAGNRSGSATSGTSDAGAESGGRVSDSLTGSAGTSGSRSDPVGGDTPSRGSSSGEMSTSGSGTADADSMGGIGTGGDRAGNSATEGGSGGLRASGGGSTIGGTSAGAASSGGSRGGNSMGGGTSGSSIAERGMGGVGTSGLGQETDFDRPGTASGSGMGSRDGGAYGSDDDRSLGAKARDAASTARERATEKVQDRLDGQVHRATDSLQSVAQSLRTAGEQLPPDNGMSRYMLQAASQVDNLASFLDNRELTEIIDEVEDFARRQPTAFLGGAFALGMLGARFLKSSRRNIEPRYGSRDWDSGNTRSGFGDPGRGSMSDSHSADYSSMGRPGMDRSPDFL